MRNPVADALIIAKLGRRIAKTRLAANLTQAGLAEAAGVSKRTVERLEAGHGAQLINLVRCLRALDRVDGLALLAPEPPRGPLDRLDLRAEGADIGPLSRLWWSSP